MAIFPNFVYGDVVFGSNVGGIDREKLYRAILKKNDRDQVLWARETEHPLTQTLVFTKTAGRQPGWGRYYLRSSRKNAQKPRGGWGETVFTR